MKDLAIILLSIIGGIVIENCRADAARMITDLKQEPKAVQNEPKPLWWVPIQRRPLWWLSSAKRK